MLRWSLPGYYYTHSVACYYYTHSVACFIITCICVYRGDESSCGQTDVIRLCETWFDGQKKINDSSSDLVADIILGLSAQPAEREDAVIVEDLLGKQ